MFFFGGAGGGGRHRQLYNIAGWSCQSEVGSVLVPFPRTKMEVHAPSRSFTGQYYSDDINLMEEGEVVNDTEEEGNVGKEYMEV